MTSFAKRLKSLREEKQLYQKDLADALGLSRSTITAYEAGKREPDQNTLKHIANLFNVSVDYLIGHTDIREKPKSEKKDSNATYPLPREFDEILRETNVLFEGDPLSSEDKEDVIEFIKVALKAIKKRDQKHKNKKSPE